MKGKLWRAVCLLLLFGAAAVWALGGGGGGKIGSGGARTDTVNIELQNVPYVQQNIDTYYAGVGAEALTRSDSYCGLASAMMVRAMGDDYTDMSSRAWDFRSWNRGNYALEMWEFDKLLRYSARNISLENLDIHDTYSQNRRGLLYRDAGSDKDNFTATKKLLEKLYTTNYFGTAHSFGREENVRSVEVQVVDETEVIDIIWKHIEKHKKPVVTIIDSNKIDDLYSTDVPFLHYNVVYGIREENSIKKFLIHDPWFTYKQFSTQKTSVYRKMLSLPSNTPDWLYRYGRSKGISNPCYIMTVK